MLNLPLLDADGGCVPFHAIGDFVAILRANGDFVILHTDVDLPMSRADF